MESSHKEPVGGDDDAESKEPQSPDPTNADLAAASTLVSCCIILF